MDKPIFTRQQNLDMCMKAFNREFPKILAYEKLQWAKEQAEFPEGVIEQGTCFNCDAAGDIMQHHIVPVSMGGKKTLPLCETCHGKVHDRSFLNHTNLIRKGLEKAKANGVKFGRPKGKVKTTEKKLDDHKDIVRQLRDGQSLRNAAKITGKSTATVQMVKKLLTQLPS